VKLARIQSGWAKTEQEKGKYDWAWLDEIIPDMVAQGVEPWVCICDVNTIRLRLSFGRRSFQRSRTCGELKCSTRPPEQHDMASATTFFAAIFSLHWEEAITPPVSPL
jgi:hypothetical protein